MADFSLRDRFNITTLTAQQIEGARRADRNARRWSRLGRRSSGARPAGGGAEQFTPDQLTGLLRPLPPRYYSIASSRDAVGEEAHLLVAGVRYETHGRQRAGVASIDHERAAEKRRPAQCFPASEPAFPPAEGSLTTDHHDRTSIGVAPFRGFLQQREATGAKGRNWLVFGHRNYLHDFLYQLEWQDWIKDGVLTRLDVAFSRDQPDKRYVAHTACRAGRGRTPRPAASAAHP